MHRPNQMIPIAEIHVTDSIRKEFPEADLALLRSSIQEQGLLQPLGVCPLPTGGYRLVWGHRRLHCCQALALPAVACIVLGPEMSAADQLQLQLIENCCRTDPNPLETALALQELTCTAGLGAQELAALIHASPAWVSRHLALLKLPGGLQKLVSSKSLPVSCAVELARLDDPDRQSELADQVVAGELTRDQLTSQVQSSVGRRSPAKAKPPTVKLPFPEGVTVTLSSSASNGLDPVIACLTKTLAALRKAARQGQDLQALRRLLELGEV